MFDIAFSELVVIAVVALIVIGPEKLPKVARTVGLLVGRVQRYISTVKTDIDRELRAEELRQLQQDIHSSAQQVQSEIKRGLLDEMHEAEQSIASPVKSIAPPPVSGDPEHKP